MRVLPEGAPVIQVDPTRPDTPLPSWVREQLIRHAPEGLACIDEEGLILGWNASLAELLGQRNPEWLLKPLDAILGEADKPIAQRLLSDLASIGMARTESVLQAADSDERLPGEVTALRASRDAEPLVVLVYVRDDADRRRLSDAAAELEGQHRFLMDRAGGLVMVLDSATGELLHANAQAEDYLRAPITRLKGRLVRELLQECDAFTTEGSLDVFLQHRGPDVELWLPSPAGFQWQLHMSSAEVVFHGTPAIEWVGQDVTARGASTAAAADSTALPVDRISSVAESLRHPASQIELIARYSLNHPDLPWRDRRERLEQIQELGDRIRTVSEDLLYLTQLMAGTVDIQRTETTVGKLLGSILPRVQRRAMAQGSEILSVHVQEEASLYTDARLLIHALRRFLDRALDTGSKTITLMAYRDGDCIRAIIIDAGPGMSADRVDRLVGAQAADSLSNASASPQELPLTLAVQLLAQVGGHVEIDSSAMGTRVTMTLLG